MLDVPNVVREKALAVGATEWLDALPELVHELEADWEITVGAAFPFSTEAFVAEVACIDGTPAVLKLVVPRDGDAAAHEATALRLAGGEGCARLLRKDLERGALLLEKLGRSLSELGLPLQARHEVLVAAAQRVWRPAAASGLPTGDEKASSLSRFITEMWDELGGPCSRAAVDYALECAERRRRAHRDDRAVLVHGDVHQWNALEAADGFRLVDPDGLLAEPEYDLGIIMREDPLDGDLRRRAAWLAERTGLDEEAIWNGASSSGSPRACSEPASPCSPSRARCSRRPSGSPADRRADTFSSAEEVSDPGPSRPGVDRRGGRPPARRLGPGLGE